MKQSFTSKTRRIMLVWALVLAATLSPFADAFRSSVTATPLDVVSLDLPTKQIGDLPKAAHPDDIRKANAESSTFDDEQTTTTPPRKFTYDLGLEKNKPLIQKRTEETDPTDESLHPARFMIEHEAVSNYPSPLDSSRIPNAQTKSVRKNLPKVNHRRHSEDVLHIRDSPSIQNNNGNRKEDGNYRHPVIAPIHELTNFDVNTVWVEMMLHNERNKMLLAAQSSLRQRG